MDIINVQGVMKQEEAPKVGILLMCVSFLQASYDRFVQRSRSQARGRVGRRPKFTSGPGKAADCQSCLLKASRIVELEARVSKLSGAITRLSQVSVWCARRGRRRSGGGRVA